jgi:hypothetical protein
MYLVAIAWLYVVVMMALAEALSPQGSVLGAFITLMLYGVLPVVVVLYIMGAPHRRRARLAVERAEQAEQAEGAERAGTAQPAAGGSAAAPPDGGGQPPRDAVAPVRKEA